jgi:general secretion pathway protein H
MISRCERRESRRGHLAQGSETRGFTLLEIIVALAIIGLTLALAFPNVSRGPSRAELSATTRDVASLLRTTRMRAIDGNRSTDFVADAEHSVFGLKGAEPHRLPRGIRMTITTSTDRKRGETGIIRFYPDGSASGGSVFLSAGGLQYEVHVNWLSGGVAIREASSRRL